MRIFVANIPYEATARELRDALIDFGVVALDFPHDRVGASKGFAFAEVRETHARRLIAASGEIMLHGRPLRFEEARSPGRRGAVAVS